MSNKWKALMRSRKFWAACAGLLAVILHALLPDLPLEEEQLVYIIVLITSYILGTAIEDAGRGEFLTLLPGGDGSADES